MTILLSLHLLAIGIWIGVVGAEFAIEFDGMKDDKSLLKAAKLHYTTDKWVEIPAFVTVLITGILMLDETHLTGLFLVKVIFGLLAVLFNFICVIAVFKRQKFAAAQDFDGMKSTDRLMRLGALVIPTFLIAFALGAYFVAI